MRVEPSWPNHLLKSTPVNTAALGIRFRTRERWGTHFSDHSTPYMITGWQGEAVDTGAWGSLGLWSVQASWKSESGRQQQTNSPRRWCRWHGTPPLLVSKFWVIGENNGDRGMEVKGRRVDGRGGWPGWRWAGMVWAGGRRMRSASSRVDRGRGLQCGSGARASGASWSLGLTLEVS